ncbi:MAG TPA: ion channel [Acidobacteriaceae bacterium]|nr:ion channel [Acidobacteriaceae bacterium]
MKNWLAGATRLISIHRSELLAGILIVQMISSPLADARPHLGAVLALIVLLLILAATTYEGNQRIVRRVALPLTGLWLIARFLEACFPSCDRCAHISPVAGLALSCAILWAIHDHFSSASRFSRGLIADALISYLVIAIAFSQLYWILSRFIDRPFNQYVPITQSSTYLYFSMITLSGVGYGGIVPINPYIRLIAAVENIVGIFYVAVVVARFVASYSSRAPEEMR